MPKRARSRKGPVRLPAAARDELKISTAQGEAIQSAAARHTPSTEPNGSVVIDLQEGFLDDSVAIRVGDQEVFRRENVSTDSLLGMAGSVEARVPEGPVIVEVSVPSRHLSDTIQLNVPPNAHLGVTLREQQIFFRLSGEGFTYF